jgi:hypothetical protein
MVGLRDETPKFTIVDGAVRYAQHLDFFGVDAFAAATVAKGEVRTLLTNEVKPDADGDRKLNLSSPHSWWSHRTEQFDVAAASKPILRDVVPQLELAIVDAPRTAKIRARVADLRESKLAPLINTESYLRSRRVSAGNVYFFHTLAEQLHVPVRQAAAEAERLMGAKPVCPLGGAYEVGGGGFRGVPSWRSTAWNARNAREDVHLPPGYRSPLFDWFAGGSLDFDIDETTLTTHIEIDVRK